MKSIEESNYLNRLLENYSRELTRPQNDWPSDVRDALIFLNTHLFETTCTVKKMRKQCHLKQRNFSTRFRNYVGVPPVGYLIYHRVEAAKMLLLDEKLDESYISEIGFAVGYEKPSAFTMLFIKNEQLSPGKWKWKHRRNEQVGMEAKSTQNGLKT